MPYSIVKKFEETVAEYAGSRYAVAVESCTAAIFLSCMYNKIEKVTIPCRTYPSVPCSIIHAGGTVEFSQENWSGVYPLSPYPIYDAALRFKRDMYVPGSFYCLSFHCKKHIPIGRGGMILVDDWVAYNWLKRARFDGRGEVPLHNDKIDMLGWNMYMTPEQAARGLMLFSMIKNRYLLDLDVASQGYPDLSKISVYTRGR